MFAIDATIAGVGAFTLYVPIAAMPIDPLFQPYA
jgi:hypothetical protein